MKNDIGILGYGEVGSSLKGLYDLKNIKTVVKDKEDQIKFCCLEVLNICIPFSKDFTKIVIEEIKQSNAQLTIIHSTVPIGTTSSIHKELNSRCCIVHSPVRGNHPNLTKSLQTFVKYIGSPIPKALSLATTHLRKLDISVSSCNTFEKTEAAKLLCTTYYGLCIAWHNEIKNVCEQFDVDIDFIKDWNLTYNEGYTSLGQEQFNRPILNPPENHKIGGHCVMPNAEMLDTVISSALIKEILTYK
jgi:UDP-N-acetyl-D-mannosaminuronate dehydrogenase